MTDYLVGTDIGTGGTKSVLIDGAGNVLGSHYIEYPLIIPRPGWAEHNPEWYWNAVVDTIKASIKESRGAPLGNAINAGVGVGIFKDYHIIKDWLTITDEIKPNPKLHQLYNKMYRIYRELYPALKKYYKELAQIN